MKGYTRYLESKRVEWNEDRNVKQVWEQVKKTMVECAIEVCASVRVGVNPPKMNCGMIILTLQLKGRSMHRVRCWELGMRLQKKDVWKFIKKSMERLQGTYIRSGR